MIGEQVNEVVNNLCNKLSTTQEMLVPEMARLHIARSWVDGIFCAVLSVIFLVGLVVSIKKMMDGEEWAVGIGVFGVCLFFSFISLWYNVSEAVQWQAAPTAKAVEYIIELIRQK